MNLAMPVVTTRPVVPRNSRGPVKRARGSEPSAEWAGTPSDRTASSRHSRHRGGKLAKQKRHKDGADEEAGMQEEVDQAGPSRGEVGRVGRRVKFAVDNVDEDEPVDDERFEAEVGDTEGDHQGAREAREVKQSILVLHPHQGCQLAAAFFDPAEKRITVLEDAKDSSSWDLAVLIMEQCTPDVIVTSTNAKDGLRDRVEAYCAENDRSEYDLQKSSDFSIGRAVDLMGDFNLTEILTAPHAQSSQATLSPQTPSSLSSGSTREEKQEDQEMYADDYAGMGKRRMTLVKMGCLVNVDAPLAMMAMGALLSYLAGTKKSQRNEEVRFPIEKVESMALEQHMLINRDALQSLAIIEDADQSRDEHEYQNLRKSQKLTLFNLFNTCSSAAGRKLFRLWFLRPLLDIDEINKRHDAVSVFSAADLRVRASTRSGYEDNASLAEDVRKRIRGVKAVAEMMKRLREGKAHLTEWKGITEAVAAVVETKELLRAFHGAEKLEVVQRFEATVSPDLYHVMRLCTANIDWDMSRDEKRMCVSPTVDADLDELKKEQKTIDLVLTQLATKLTQEVDQHFFSELKCTYWDQFGFLVRVKTRGDGYPAPQGFDLIMIQDDIYFFKTPEVRQLDDHYGDIGGVIRIKEAEVIATMAFKVAQYEAEFKKIVEVVAELDCLLALAKAATAHDLVRPTMAPSPILNIRRGRHLLQELCVTAFVANDTKIEGGPDGERYHSMMIVTGANASGKSAYGKQVALIAFMAQIGSFVPAQEATIGVVDKIFTRIQTRESVSKPASAFMIDLEQVSHALRGATERSLIILDEFGKGTETADGAGLLAGVIEHLLNGSCPRTVVLTHFHELFTQQFISEDLQIQFCYMKAEFIEGSGDLAYLYKLKPGRCDSSFAAECALAHGMPKKIVDRGREVTNLLATHQLDKLWEIDLTPKEVRELEKCETLARRFLSWDIDPETTEVMETLQSIFESAVGVEEEDDETMDEDEPHQDQDQVVQASSQLPVYRRGQGYGHQADKEQDYVDSSDEEHKNMGDDQIAQWTVELY